MDYTKASVGVIGLQDNLVQEGKKDGPWNPKSAFIIVIVIGQRVVGAKGC
jgi:hypothetical protein